jgi:hypothetical protein
MSSYDVVVIGWYDGGDRPFQPQLHHFAGGATKILDHTDAAQIDRDEDAAAAAGMLGHG